MKDNLTNLQRFRWRLHEIIFEADTKVGKLFDIILIVSIVSSVLVVMLDSVVALRNLYGGYFYGLEWGFTLLFTIEYILRLL
ncbi:MAG: ion transporter, partial [Deltaproteobacteria bacterium]